MRLKNRDNMMEFILMIKRHSIFSGMALLIVSLFSGCTMIGFGAAAIAESRRANSPEIREQRKQDLAKKLVEVMEISEAAERGNNYARIELARKCFESGYPCGIREPEKVFKHYSELGYEIATYYYGSYKLGLDPWGYKIEKCRESVFSLRECADRNGGTELLNNLALKGCEYEVQAYERHERIYPCSQLKRNGHDW